MVSLVLLDDHRMLLESLGAALRRRGHIVLAMEPTAARGLAACQELRPDVCLMDRRLPDADGLDAVRELSARAPGTRVVVLSESVGRAEIAALRAAGADGLLSTRSSIDEVSMGITTASRGRGIWPQSQPLSRPSLGAAALAVLTTRERQVLELFASGVRTSDVAAALDISVNTARTHVQRVLSKLGVSNRFQAAHLLHSSQVDAAVERPRSA